MTEKSDAWAAQHYSSEEDDDAIKVGGLREVKYRNPSMKLFGKPSITPQVFEEAGILICKENKKDALRRWKHALKYLVHTFLCTLLVSIFSLNATDRQLWRKTIHDDASQWLQFMKNICVSPDMARLIPFCSFITPEIESARMKKGGFDARFYLCVANEAEMEYCSSDNSEVFSLMWVSPNEALSLLVGGEHINMS